jgi:hypothetical protein
MQQFEMKISDVEKRHSRLQIAAIALSSALILDFGLFALWARTCTSTLFGNVLFSAAFSIIYSVLAFPILIGVGFLLRWTADRLLKRPLSGRTYIPWLIPAVLGIGCFACSFLQDRSPRTLFRNFLNMDPPGQYVGLPILVGHPARRQPLCL